MMIIWGDMFMNEWQLQDFNKKLKKDFFKKNYVKQRPLPMKLRNEH